jgi:hypothetical protein
VRQVERAEVHADLGRLLVVEVRHHERPASVKGDGEGVAHEPKSRRTHSVEDIGFQTHRPVAVQGSGSLPGLGGFVAVCPCSVRERGANPCYSSRLAGPEIVA